MLYGVFYGHAVGEAMWAVEGGQVVLADVRVRDRRRFGFDGEQRLRLKTFANPDGELLPERKFWHFSTGSDHDDAPYGLGLAHWLYWPVWLKRNGIRFWAVFLEKFGTPTAVGRFPPGASPTDQAKLLSALNAIQRDSAIIFPEGMQAELLEATRSGSADHAAFADRMNAAILVITIGQTASTQGTPGKLGNEENQKEVRQDIVRADADLVCMSFNASIARWLTDWNYPGAAYPQLWRSMEEPEDQDKLAERDLKLSQVGFKPSLERVTEVYGEGYEPVSPDPIEGGGANSSAPAAAEFAAPNPDAAERLADQLVALAAPETAAWLAQIEALLDGADSLEEFRARLLAAYPDLDRTRLAQTLGQAFQLAELAGMDAVREET